MLPFPRTSLLRFRYRLGRDEVLQTLLASVGSLLICGALLILLVNAEPIASGVPFARPVVVVCASAQLLLIGLTGSALLRRR
jgi:hypothetical protein